MATEPPVVTASVVRSRRSSAPWYIWVIVVGIIVGAISLQRGSDKPKTQAAIEPQVTPEMRESAKNLVAGYTENGIISSVTSEQAMVSQDWYALTFDNKKNLAGAIKVHFNAEHYKFLDLHTGKVVAEYDKLWGFRVK